MAIVRLHGETRVTSGRVERAHLFPRQLRAEPAWRPREHSWACRAEGNWGEGLWARDSPLLCRLEGPQVWPPQACLPCSRHTFQQFCFCLLGWGFNSLFQQTSPRDKRGRPGFYLAAAPSTQSSQDLEPTHPGVTRFRLRLCPERRTPPSVLSGP